MEKVRDHKMDYIKGVTIFLMIWGHIVQHFYGSERSFYSNEVYKTIYTFHMPLFMFISGYFFKFSLDKRSFIEIIRSKLIQLGIPIFIWTCFYYAEDLIYTGKAFELSQLFHLFFRRLWFLSSYFMLAVIISLIWQFFKSYNKKFIAACVITGFFILVVPDELFSAVFLKFMYPYFVAGILANVFKDLLERYKKPVFILSLLIYIPLFIFWKDNYYVYTSGMYLPFGTNALKEQVWIIYYRYIIGFAGIGIVMGLLSFLYTLGHNKLLIVLGQHTLELYIVHIFFLNYFGRWGLGNYIHLNEWIYNFIFTPLISIVLTLICMGIIKLLYKNKYTKGILFGNWRQL